MWKNPSFISVSSYFASGRLIVPYLQNWDNAIWACLDWPVSFVYHVARLNSPLIIAHVGCNWISIIVCRYRVLYLFSVSAWRRSRCTMWLSLPGFTGWGRSCCICTFTDFLCFTARSVMIIFFFVSSKSKDENVIIIQCYTDVKQTRNVTLYRQIYIQHKIIIIMRNSKYTNNIRSKKNLFMKQINVWIQQLSGFIAYAWVR